MECPSCGSSDLKVLETRRAAGGLSRRRSCLACGFRFGTLEHLTSDHLRVRKDDGRVEPYREGKLRVGLGKSARRLALPPEVLDGVVARVRRQAVDLARGEPLPARELGHRVLEELDGLGPVGDVVRVRYALVFLGKTTHPDGFRDAGDAHRWLVSSYPHLERQGPATGEGPVVLKRPEPYPGDRRGGAEPFDRGKLERSIGVAAKGRGTDAQVRGMATLVARDAISALEGVPLVGSQQIAAEVLRVLRATDGIAYLRYASVVKRFASVDRFLVEAAALAGRDVASSDGDAARRRGEARPPTVT